MTRHSPDSFPFPPPLHHLRQVQTLWMHSPFGSLGSNETAAAPVLEYVLRDGSGSGAPLALPANATGPGTRPAVLFQLSIGATPLPGLVD